MNAKGFYFFLAGPPFAGRPEEDGLGLPPELEEEGVTCLEAGGVTVVLPPFLGAGCDVGDVAFCWPLGFAGAAF